LLTVLRSPDIFLLASAQIRPPRSLDVQAVISSPDLWFQVDIACSVRRNAQQRHPIPYYRPVLSLATTSRVLNKTKGSLSLNGRSGFCLCFPVFSFFWSGSLFALSFVSPFPFFLCSRLLLVYNMTRRPPTPRPPTYPLPYIPSDAVVLLVYLTSSNHTPCPLLLLPAFALRSLGLLVILSFTFLVSSLCPLPSIYLSI
jgi:hypothetical protein